MTHIEKHLARMLTNDRTTMANLTDELLSEISAVNLDKRALESLGRHVLSVISADLKSGLHAQKALHAAMQGSRDV